MGHGARTHSPSAWPAPPRTHTHSHTHSLTRARRPPARRSLPLRAERGLSRHRRPRGRRQRRWRRRSRLQAPLEPPPQLQRRVPLAEPGPGSESELESGRSRSVSPGPGRPRSRRCPGGSPRWAWDRGECGEPSGTRGKAAGGDQGALVSGGQVQGRTQPAIQEGSAGEREAASEEDHTLCSFCCAGGAGLSLPSSFAGSSRRGAARSDKADAAAAAAAGGGSNSSWPARPSTRENVKVCLSSSIPSLNTPSDKGGSKWPRCIDRVQRQAVEGRQREQAERETDGKRTRRVTERAEEGRAPGNRRSAGHRVLGPSPLRTLNCVVGHRKRGSAKSCPTRETTEQKQPCFIKPIWRDEHACNHWEKGDSVFTSQVVVDVLNICIGISSSSFARGVPEPHCCGKHHDLESQK
ncbi:serine/arginine repetitive matrix protein 2-like [Phyllostomus discolor]|uniref:Serine/arginine repetitive matrix protein 2-like n=1 Tax=Phyllostomus discolor TaxID=89673 RepID=A0A7E6DCH6_9CHIR|nr:serine/arginine repetitive matrix protein 2-like [Phyllostomus discolor]